MMATPQPAEAFPPPHLAPCDAADGAPTAKLYGAVQVPELAEKIHWTLEVPEGNLAYNGVVLLLPGFGGIKRSSRGERHANAAAGEPSLSYDPARISGSLLQNLVSSQSLHTTTAELVIADMQAQLQTAWHLPHHHAIDPHRLTASAHSMGGYPATSLALNHPGWMDAIIYKAAAGFGTPSWHAPWQLNLPATCREIGDFVQSDQIDRTARNLLRIMYYYGRSPSRTLGEAATCLTTSIAADVERLNESGIPTAYLGFELDGLVPIKVAEPVARQVVNEVKVMPGVGHLAPQRYPVDTAAQVSALRQRITS